MSQRTFKRSKLHTLLGLATAGLMLSAASIHAQAAASPKADSESGKASSSQMNKQSGTSGAASPAPSEAGKSSSGMSGSSQGAGASGASSAAGAMAGSDSKAAAGKLAKSDQDMMKKIAQTNIAEIETAKLAQEKSKSEEVVSFAKKMIDDHTKAQSELQTIAQSKNVSLPSQPDAKHQAAMKKLSALSGAEFDKQYMKQAGVADHRDAHKLLQRVSKQAKDNDLKQYAAKTIEAIDQHGKMAGEMKVTQGAASGSDKAGASGSSGAAGSSSGTESGKAGSAVSK